MSESRADRRRLTRRQFLVAIGATGASAALARVFVDGSVGRPAGRIEARRTGTAMGSEVSIVVGHESERVAEAALDAAFAELEQVEAIMSLYREESQIRRLNRDGWLAEPHPYLVEVLEVAGRTSRASGGAFDVTVQPLWEAHAEARRTGAGSPDGPIAAAGRRVDWRKLSVSADRIELAGPDMAITLNGIAQGYAADRVVAVLRSRGIRHALVDAGEFGAIGNRTDGDPWRIGVQHPRRTEDLLARIALDGRFVATSGDYAAGAPEHIYDPRRGAVSRRFQSVTIVARRGVEADALSTAVFVLGPEEGLALVESVPEADALVVTEDGRTLATGGFPLSA